ncbi:DUF892 family protein [Flavihumibacter petaseus]|uniref:Uncharacterized protein n=1 Tax=Flavihumibacter petaseus NBRC 106054 TaxID=1220578 RepID=A0A0E9N1C4_9BACT|nr:DUF892 family protein [Flavihumibacter petaseus]GAO43441.1 hypothetical protein FPE01S_02_05460 [Flavihumibacter petaseus NBRC 106054]
MSNTKKSTRQGTQHAEHLGKILDESLKDIYWAENHLVKTLPKLSAAATDELLKEAFDAHLGQTREHVAIVEQVFKLLGKEASGKRCAAMAGLSEEALEVVEQHEAGAAKDAALIMSAQKAEHYEIAAYGSMVSFAIHLGREDVADLLTEVLS